MYITANVPSPFESNLHHILLLDVHLTPPQTTLVEKNANIVIECIYPVFTFCRSQMTEGFVNSLRWKFGLFNIWKY